MPGGVEVEGDGEGDEFVGEGVGLRWVGFEKFVEIGVVLGILVGDDVGGDGVSGPPIEDKE